MGSGRLPRAAVLTAALAALCAALALAAVPAHAARLRAYGVSTGARSYTLVVDGRTRLAVTRRRVTRQLVLGAGSHTLVARAGRRRLARQSLRLSATNAVVVTIARDPRRRWRLVVSPEGPATSTATTFHVTNLANLAASQGALVMEEQFDSHRLVVARNLAFGRATVALRISPTAAANGSARVIARRAGGPVPLASVVLPLATRYAASYFVVPHGKGIAIEQMPAPVVPLATRAPSVTGSVRLGQTLTCNPGAWRNVPRGGAKLEWLRGTRVVAGATSTTYRLTSADAGSFITCLVIARRGIYTVRAHSTAKFLQGVPTLAPGNQNAIFVDGSTPDVGTQLTCVTTAANWTGLPESFTYQWLRSATPILGATARTYTLQLADNAIPVSCVVVAHGPGGNSAPTKSQTSVALGVRPANTHLPTLTRPAGPPPLIGQNATCISNVNTDWTNLPTSLKVEWLRDSSVVQTDANQMGDGTGLVTSTYQIGTADRTHTISCRVSATNVFGTTLTPTPATLTIPMPALPGVVNAPTYTVLDAPANTNTIALNDTATCVSDPVADWEPDATGGLTYLWTQAGAPTSDTTNTYTFTAADRGKAVVCHVTATNDSGTGQAAGPALTLPNPPTIGNPSPTFFDASTSATQTYQLNGVGSWNGSPTNYSVTWSSDTSGTPGGPLGTCSGATPGDVATCRYALGSGDVAGTTITMHVIATNRGGDSGEVTAQRTVPNAPLNSVAPTLSGSASPMTLDPGTWSNSPTFFTVTFTSDQGALANNPGGTCSGPDVSSCNYAPDPATESGIATITAHVTAYNAGGPSSTLDASALAP